MCRRSEYFKRYTLLAAIFLFAFGSVGVYASVPTEEDFTDLSLEELMEIEITSVAKKSQKLFEAPAAVFVVTAEDIRRSGVTSIPEALRMVPGLQVARIDSNKWAITSRGFNGRFANKLLVLIDGRSVYTPLFSGVFWNVQDTFMEDIDRIEVIRGPGASVWGANAVNGVINIITKEARGTQGTLVSGGIGTEEHGFVGARHGNELGSDGHWRIYAKYFNRDHFVDSSGEDGADDWRSFRAGFRADIEPSHRHTLTLQGDIYDGAMGERSLPPMLVPPFAEIVDADVEVFGGHLLSRWTHDFSEASDMTLQLYYERTEREQVTTGGARHTVDAEFQHRFRLLKAQEIIWGLGYRFSQEKAKGIELLDDSREDHLFSAFVQDETTLVPDRLYLTLGSKFEHNDYTGFEIQPSGRLLWILQEGHTLWTSVARAVRTPSRIEHDVVFNEIAVVPPGSDFTALPSLPSSLPFPVQIGMIGNNDLRSEELLACEGGYRFSLWNRLTLDLAVFYNVYDNLRSTEIGDPSFAFSPGLPHIVVPILLDNKMDGETYGVELATELKPLPWWSLMAAYTFLQIQLHVDEDSTDVTSESAEGDSPHHQLSIRSSMDLPRGFALDAWVRYVDRLPSQDVSSYITMDIRIGGRPFDWLEFSIVGQNLIEDRHAEFEPELSFPISAYEVQRSVYGKVTWSF